MFENAFYYMANRKCVKYNLIFYFCPLFLRKPSPSAKPPQLTLSYWLSVSVTVITTFMQMNNWYVWQYSTVLNVIYSKETNINWKWQCSVMKAKQTHFKYPMNEAKENHKNNTKVCTMTMLVQSYKCNICPCAHHEDIWEKGITTLCIINPVLLHTMPSDNILATNLSMLTFLSLHNISLAIKWNRWLFHALHILVFLFL